MTCPCGKAGCPGSGTHEALIKIDAQLMRFASPGTPIYQRAALRIAENIRYVLPT